MRRRSEAVHSRNRCTASCYVVSQGIYEMELKILSAFS